MGPENIMKNMKRKAHSTQQKVDRVMSLFLTHRQRNISHVTDDGTIS